MYSVVWLFLLPVVLLRLLILGFRDPRYWQRWPERFGFTGNVTRRPVIWVHAVSVGEVRAALPLVKALITRYPEIGLHITTTTPTGADTVTRLFGQRVTHSYFPYDIHSAMQRVLKRINPSLVLVMETEIWPNLFHACRRRGIPLCLVNARLSADSFKRYKRFSLLSRQTLRAVSLVTAKSEADRRRFVELGIDPGRIVCPGNLKFDIDPDPVVQDQAMRLRSLWGEQRRVWVAGSTHPGEDEVMLAAHGRVLQQYPDTVLVLVPRHPERAGRIAGLCEQVGLRYSLSSDADFDRSTQVVVGDQLGELQVFYAAANVAFVGGSLVPHGGQNPLEPAIYGVPVLTGPDIRNFEDVYQKLDAAGALITVNDDVQLARQLCEWLAEPASALSAGRAGKRVAGENRGAVMNTIGYLKPFLP